MATAMEVIWAIAMAWMLGALGWYLGLRRYEPIRSREWVWQIASSFFGISIFAIFGAAEFGDPDVPIPCQLRVFPSFAIVPGFCSPYVIRSWILYFKYSEANSRAEAQSPKTRIHHWTLSHRWLYGLPFLVTLYLAPIIFSIVVSVLIFELDPAIDKDFINSNTYIYSVQYVCSNWSHMQYLLVIQALLIITCVVTSIYYLWRAQDAFYVKDELKLICVFAVPFFILWCVQSFWNPWPSFSGNVWVLALIFSFQNVSCTYPVCLVYYQRYKIKMIRGRRPSLSSSHTSTQGHPGEDGDEMTAVANSGGLDAQPHRKVHKLERLLQTDPAFVTAFRDFCIQSWCIESLNLVFAMFEFDKLTDDDERRDSALDIWKTFLQPNAPQELNLEGVDCDRVNERMTRGDTAPDIFDAVRNHTIKLLWEDTYWRFNAQTTFNHSSPA